MSWFERFLRWLLTLFEREPTTPPPDQPEPPGPVPGPAPDRIQFPSGAIKTRGPNGRDLSHISWSQLSRWEPLFTKAAQQEGKNRFGPLLLACFAVIESEGNHFTHGRTSGSDHEVIKGHGDPRSRGLLQIRHDLHDPQMRQLQPEAHIRLGAKLLGDWMDQTGSWEEALRRKWHPGTDPVSQIGQEEYIRTVRDLIKEVKASWPAEPTPPPKPGSGNESTYAVAGLSTAISLPFPLIQQIIPKAQTRQRPGIRMDPAIYIQHDTGNRNPGANAAMHSRYLHDGAPDNYGRPQQLSYHLTVDDRQAFQMIPLNEVAWHGGDSGGPCNMSGIACELCIHVGINEPRSRENAAILAAEIMNALDIPDVPWPHKKCSGKNCPQDLLQDGDWASWLERVRQLRKERAR